MILITTQGMTDEASFDYWHEVTRRTYRLAVPKRGRRRFHMRAAMWTNEDYALSDFEAESNTKWRDPAIIRRDGRAYLKLRRYLSGSAVILTGGHTYPVSSGATHLIDQSRPVVEISRENRQLNVFIPHEAVGYDPVRHDVCVSLPDRTVAGKLVAAAVEGLVSGMRAGTAPHVGPNVSDVVSLVRLALAGGTDSEETSAREARIRLVRSFIEQNIQNPALGVSLLVATGHASRATLYRDFADVGGIWNYIRNRRLHHALRRLANAPAHWGLIGKVAEQSGFRSIHAFSRAFRAEFGSTPSDIAGVLDRQADAPPGLGAQCVAIDGAAQHVMKLFEAIRSA